MNYPKVCQNPIDHPTHSSRLALFSNLSNLQKLTLDVWFHKEYVYLSDDMIRLYYMYRSITCIDLFHV